jgi:cell division protein FtsI/penicillin-binding protein 2
VFFIAIIVKLFYLQLFHQSSSFLDNYLKTDKINPERGRVFDHNGQPLVLNQNSYLLYFEPKKIQDPRELSEKLAPILQIPVASIESKIDQSKVWVSFKSGIIEDQKKAIDSLQIKGIGFQYQMKRYYPEASLSAHLAGFVGKNASGEDIGYFGLEGFYDKDLRGLPGFLETERDIIGRPIFIGTQERVNSENGRDLQLSIDKTVQEIIKRKLKQGLESYKAKQGCVIAADPDSMQIIGMACLPDYDNDQYYEFSEEYFKNPAISEVYEPGSIFKPLIMAAALEEKKVKPDDFYEEGGPVEISGYTIRTWNNKYEGRISMTRILEKSSNVGMVYIGERLGNDYIYQYLQKYGFGEITGVDLQGEATGYLKPKVGWYPIDYSTVTFGQGIAVTPIQMIRAFASIINGGKLLKPMVVEKINTSRGGKTIRSKVERIVIHEKTTQMIKKMLVSTVENGEVHWAKPKGYTIGGKTGTAQVPIQGRYDPSKTIASFVGFAPAENPKFITLVILREPQTSPWGSETAAPLFFDIAKELIVYYNITPDQ